MSNTSKKNEILSVMTFFQYFIAVVYTIYGSLCVVIGSIQQYKNKVVFGIILVLTAIIAIIAIINIKKKSKNGYIFSIISLSILIAYTFIYKLTEDPINLKLKSLQVIEHDFFKDPFLSLSPVVFLFIVLFIFIFSPRVKSYFNIEHKVNEDRKPLKLITIFIIYCSLVFLNITFQVWYFQPASFTTNNELVLKSEKYIGTWLTVKSFDQYEHNDNKFSIKFRDDGYVIYSVPDDDRDFSVNWDGYIVDINNNEIIIGKKLLNNSYDAEFVLSIEEFDATDMTMMISGNKGDINSKGYKFKKL